MAEAAAPGGFSNITPQQQQQVARHSEPMILPGTAAAAISGGFSNIMFEQQQVAFYSEPMILPGTAAAAISGGFSNIMPQQQQDNNEWVRSRVAQQRVRPQQAPPARGSGGGQRAPTRGGNRAEAGGDDGGGAAQWRGGPGLGRRLLDALLPARAASRRTAPA